MLSGNVPFWSLAFIPKRPKLCYLRGRPRATHKVLVGYLVPAGTALVTPDIVWNFGLSPTWIYLVSRLCPSFGICWSYRRWCCRFCRWSRPASRWKGTALYFCPSHRPTSFGCRWSRTGRLLRRWNPSGTGTYVKNVEIFIDTSSISSYWPQQVKLTVTPVSHGFRGHSDVLVFVLLCLFPFFSQPVIVLNKLNHLLHPLAHINTLVLPIFIWGQQMMTNVNLFTNYLFTKDCKDTTCVLEKWKAGSWGWWV